MEVKMKGVAGGGGDTGGRSNGHGRHREKKSFTTVTVHYDGMGVNPANPAPGNGMKKHKSRHDLNDLPKTSDGPRNKNKLIDNQYNAQHSQSQSQPQAQQDIRKRTSKSKEKQSNGNGKSKPVSTQNRNRKVPKSSNNTRVMPMRKKSLIESPAKRLNKRLLHLISELRKSNDYYKQELKKVQGTSLEEVFLLQWENETLSRENVKLSQKNEKLRERCRQQENRDVTLTKSKTLSKENHELQEDLGVYKSVVCRLNKELMACQEKLQIQRDLLKGININRESEGLNNSSSDEMKTTSSACMENPTKLHPLLLAYDEVILEKDEIIKDHEKALVHFKSRCKQILKENEDLHEIISKRQEQGTVSIDEWQFLHSNSLIVLEENEILQNKTQLYEKKEALMIKSHQEKTQQMKMTISALLEEKKLLQSAVTKSDSHCKKLLDQLSKLSSMIENRIPIDQHEASVKECKSLFEELRFNYSAERGVLLERIENAEQEKNRLINELAELEAANGRLQSNLKTCEDTLTNNAVQFREVHNRMTEAIKARDATNSTMEETIEFSHRLVTDRDNVERMLQEQRLLNENLVQFRERQLSLVTELQHKIKEMENVHAAEIDKLFRTIREFETRKEGVNAEYHQQICCMEQLVEEKSKRIDHLEAEKRQLELDLETVWRTTTSTIKDMAKG